MLPATTSVCVVGCALGWWVEYEVVFKDIGFFLRDSLKRHNGKGMQGALTSRCSQVLSSNQSRESLL